MQVHCYYPKGHPHFSKTPLPTASKYVVVQGTCHNPFNHLIQGQRLGLKRRLSQQRKY
ncbi:hypothetical protein BDR04DRAFT_287317 [Suillus decipiens]|nr:hypothetical protein BDR04DRAFT_287317 [Suillus decipiens]